MAPPKYAPGLGRDKTTKVFLYQQFYVQHDFKTYMKNF